MYHNCWSLCSLCEGKEGGKAIYISIVFMNYRNYNQHAADYLFGSDRQVSVGLWRQQQWNSGNERF